MMRGIWEYFGGGDPMKPVRRLLSMGLCGLAIAVCFYERGNQKVQAKPFPITSRGQLATHYQQKVELTGILRVTNSEAFLVCGGFHIKLPHEPPPSLWDSKVTVTGMLEYEPLQAVYRIPPEVVPTYVTAPRECEDQEDSDGMTDADMSGIQTNVPLDVADEDRATDVQPGIFGFQTNMPLEADTWTMGDVYWLMDCSIRALPAGR